jgi:hypothetical protein
VEGILVRKKNQFRLVLSVDMLAKSVAVEIDAADVESACEPTHGGRASSMRCVSVPSSAVLARPSLGVN